MNSFPRKCYPYLRTFFFFCLILIVCHWWASQAFGQVSIIPVLQEIEVNRGGTTSFHLQIANRGSDSLRIILHAYDLAITEEGLPSAIAVKTERSCVDWITFTPQTFDLAPDEVKIVQGLVHASTEAEGGYSTFIAAEFGIFVPTFSFGENEKTQAQIKLGQAVSSILLVTARSSKNKATLIPDSLILASGRESSSEMTMGLPTSGNNGVWMTSLMVENTGNIHTRALGEVSIWMEGARLVEKADLTANLGYILPGKKRLFRAEGKKALADGVYLVKVQIRTKEGQMMQNSFPFSIVNGKSIPGAASEGIRELLRASSPVFSLSTRMMDYKITPQGRRTRGITLQNYSPDTISVQARIVDWSLDDSGKVVLQPNPTILVRPCASWLEVSPNPVLIPPKQSSTVKITVTAPAELAGEYYAAVVFETPQTGHNLPTELELPRTLIVTVSSSLNLQYKAEIQSLDHAPVSRIMREFIVNAVNTGNVHCYASGKLEIYDRQQKLVFEPIPFGSQNDYILPGRVRGYAVPCPGALDPGTYEAVVMIDYHDGTAPAISKLNFESQGK